MELKDLSQGYTDLIEAIELVCVAETLTGSNYQLTEYDMYHYLYFERTRFTLKLPKVATQYQPAYVQLTTEKLKNIDKNSFEKEMIDSNILILKSEHGGGIGYVQVGSNRTKNYVPNWQFMFIDQKSFYDFYIICEKYKVF